MQDIDRGQISHNAAEIYEAFFIPALFQEWAERVANAAHIQTGQRVLDVASGTGILARTVMDQVGATGAVVGLDINPEMLAVAARKAPAIEWRQGKAEALPFGDNDFDAVVSQFGLMFFEDRLAAIREMVRVLRMDGQMVIAVWASLENNAGYAAMVELLQRLFGENVASGIRAPFVLGDVHELNALFRDAGIAGLQIKTLPGIARFPSIEAWIYTDIKGWVLADMLDDDQFDLLLKEAHQSLSPFVTVEGKVVFGVSAHIISATKR
ncbi:MAG: class I SAM-dependent methyltransferase [Anaerolineae bacterium]|nr:class I SAM-dependent methyltransferase [Anaerolineae bacterium]